MEVRLIDAYNHRMCSAVQFTLNVYSTGGGGGVVSGKNAGEKRELICIPGMPA